jgi:uncharacterized protein YprB with RNaseH-like and TPR domain
MDDRLRRRLSEIDRPSRPWARRKDVPRPDTLEDIAGVVSSKDVLVIERRVSAIASPAYAQSLRSGIRAAARSVAGRGDIAEEIREVLSDLGGSLFLDTETTGLAGNMVFLLGVMRINGDDAVLTQVLARDYREERALLELWRDFASSAGRFVSFNGKSFDLPTLRDRLGLHGIERPAEPLHVDLLHHARRRWARALPDCRLQTLEWRICGRRRAGDIPGEEIGGVYHEFVRTGRPDDIFTVLRHNALDILTLADLAIALAAPEDGPA